MKDFLGGLGLIGCSVLIAVLVVFGGGLMYIVYLNTIGQATMNAQREITQRSQQYVETKTSLLLKLMADIEDPNASEGQRAANVARFCQEYQLVDFDVPSTIDTYAGRNCR